MGNKDQLKMRVLLWVSTYLVLFIASSEETILRLPCKIDALFTIFHDSKRLVGDVLMSFSALEDTQCMVKCIENAKCRSYNTNKEDGRCEINGKALVDNGTKLVTDTNWVYKSTNYSSTLIGPVCNSLKPCDDKILCKDTCDPPYYKCVYCDGNHRGLDCDVAIDHNECSSNPCQNSGTCVDEFASYKCSCLNGYTGKNCEVDVDECSSLPCFNGGLCINEIGNYTCNCTDGIGYYGRNCEKNQFVVIEEGKAWVNARVKCQERGGDLASIGTKMELDLVTQLIAKYPSYGRLWIGLSDKEKEGDFVWIDGNKRIGVSWDVGEPNDGNNNEDCAYINCIRNKMNDFDCNQKLFFICKLR